MTNSQKAAEKVQKHLREMYGDDLIEIAEDVGDIATIIDTELAAEREANKKLREAVGPVAASIDVEATDIPVWYIVDPKQIMRLDIGFLMSMITGPFFSRQSAEDHLTARRHAYTDNAKVWCDSAFRSSEYVALYKASKALRSALAEHKEGM